eukprot:7227549-Prorocentrum_lima.AAC.1
MEEAYVGYEKARKRMASSATARGFYPVVALTTEAAPSSASATPRPPRDKGKGKGRARASA